MRDVPETPFFSTFFGVLGGPLLQFKSPPRYLNEEIRNVGCPAFLIFFVFGKYENTCREDFLLDEREGSVLWLVKRYTKHAAGQATGRKKW